MAFPRTFLSQQMSRVGQPVASFIAMLHSTAFRLTMSYTALFGLSVLLLLLFIYITTAQAISRQTDDTITAEIDALYQHYDTEGLNGLMDSISERISTPNLSGGLYLLTDATLIPVVGNIPQWPTATADQQGWMDFALSNSAPSEDAAYGRGRSFLLPGNYHLLVGRDMRALEGFQDLMLEAMGWAFAVTALLGVGGGLVLTRQVLARLEGINRTAERIMDGDISHRVALAGRNDEFDRLAETLNAMLDQIEHLMAGIRTVTNNIAHDLRSPLTRMRSQLERAITSTNCSEDDLRDVCAQVIGEADNLLATFNALLSIAEAEAGSTLTDIMPVDLRALVEDVTDLYGPVAEDLEISLQVALPSSAEPQWVGGNRELLFQALSNILDNALKYTPTPGQVAVWVVPGLGGNGPHLVVADSGPGIAAEDRERVVERFVRLDASRTTPGNGLGLSLVAAICRLHRASLTLASLSEHPLNALLPPLSGAHPQGLAVQISFPLLKVNL